jgi:hypothetical protein
MPIRGLQCADADVASLSQASTADIHHWRLHRRDDDLDSGRAVLRRDPGNDHYHARAILSASNWDSGNLVGAAKTPWRSGHCG